MKFEREGKVLRVAEQHLRWDYSNPGLMVGEPELTKIQAWCEETGCGRRTSFDMFKFRNEKDMAAFLLKWS